MVHLNKLSLFLKKSLKGTGWIDIRSDYRVVARRVSH
jgi:hypothetical protein